MHSLSHSCTPSVTHALSQSLMQSLSHSCTPYVTHALPQSLTLTLSHSCTPSVTHAIPQSLNYSLNSPAQSLSHSPSSSLMVVSVTIFCLYLNKQLCKEIIWSTFGSKFYFFGFYSNAARGFLAACLSLFPSLPIASLPWTVCPCFHYFRSLCYEYAEEIKACISYKSVVTWVRTNTRLKIHIVHTFFIILFVMLGLNL